MRAFIGILASSFSCLAQTTWTVNAAGGAQFTAVQPAIQAAAPGDRIVVVGSGPYAAFVVDRGVDVVATGAVAATISVVSVPAGQTARVAGFLIEQANNGWCSVDGCLGQVQLESIGRTATFAWESGVSNPGLGIKDSAAVFVRGCNFLGHSGAPGSAAPGILIENSGVTLTNVMARGGVNNPGLPMAGQSGWPGIQVLSGHTMLRDVAATGGTASGAISGGGDGLRVSGGIALVLGGCTLIGRPSYGGWIGIPDGVAAWGNVHHTPDTVLQGGTFGSTAIPARPRLSSPSTTTIGSTWSLAVQGNANQFVWIGLDLAHGYTVLPQFESALVLTSTAALLPALLLDGQGAGTLAVQIPATAAVQNVSLFAQAVAVVGGLRFTAPTTTRIQ